MLYVGRLGIEKNLNILKGVLDTFGNVTASGATNGGVHGTKVASAVGETKPSVSLALVGHGPQEEELKKLFKSYPNVHFAGQLTGM